MGFLEKYLRKNSQSVKPAMVHIYYNSQWGYIVASSTKLQDSVMNVTMEPVLTEKNDIMPSQLGKTVLEGLEKSRKAEPVGREELKGFQFWQISGIKGFAAFSKRFKCVEAAENDNVLKVQRMIRDSDGGYIWIKNNPGVELPLSTSYEQIGQTVWNLLHDEETDSQNEEQTASFQTLNDNTVAYQLPSDDFVDRGDGHTDAYQIYEYGSEEGSYSLIAFMIDNGYSEVSSQGIKKRWEQICGNVEEYRFEEQENTLYKVMASARTKQGDVRSCFFQDGEDLLEVFVEINNGFSAQQREKIEKEVKRVMDSITITQ